MTFGLTRSIRGWEEGERRERNKRKRQPGRTGAGQRREWQLNEQREDSFVHVIHSVKPSWLRRRVPRLSSQQSCTASSEDLSTLPHRGMTTALTNASQKFPGQDALPFSPAQPCTTPQRCRTEKEIFLTEGLVRENDEAAAAMAAKEAADASVPLQGNDKNEKPLQAWQMAWIRLHNDTLVERMSTADIVDQLIEAGRMEAKMDVCQKIESQATIPNERARLLLGFVKKQDSACFWDFQDALAADSASSDLAIARKDEQVVAGSFSAEELTAAFYSGWEEGRPVSVVTVNKKLKERYRALKMPALDVEAGRKPVSLAEIRVNICLLSSDKLDALCGSPGQSQPFELDSLKDKTSSVITLEDLFSKSAVSDTADLLMAAGIAGSGKSTAFTLKAAFEWAQVDCEEPFWDLFALFFTGSLTRSKLVEGQRSGGGVWTWSIRSDRGGAEGSGRIHVRPL